MTTEEKIEELEQLNAYYSNILLLGGMEFVYKNFMVTKDDKGRWVLKKYVSGLKYGLCRVGVATGECWKICSSIAR